MNIEAPASISNDTEFMWRLPFAHAFTTNDYIFDINVVEDHPNSTKEHPVKYPTWSVSNKDDLLKYFKNFPFEVRVSVKYEYHMRYQPTNSKGGYVPIVFGNDTIVLFDCNDEPMVYHSPIFKEKVR